MVFDLHKKFTRSQYFFVLCLAFLLGVVVGEYISLPALWLFGLCWVAVAGVVFFVQRTYGLLISLVCLGLFLGMFRVTLVIDSEAQNQLRQFIGHEVTLVGFVREPAVNSQKYVRYQFSVDEVKGVGKRVGAVSVIAEPFPEVAQGDHLSLTCALQVDKYRSAGLPVCFFPQVKIEQASTESLSFTSILFAVRQRFEQSLKTVLPEPVGGFVSGLLVGGTSGLSDERRDALINTGTIHLVALSGFNITIIAGFLALILQTIGLPRRYYVSIIGAILGLFVVMVGAHASIVRAAIMGMLVIIARHRGRVSSTRNALGFTAVVMAAVTPSVVLHDIGFQLSFAATIGIVYFYPTLEHKAQRFPEFFKMKEALLMSIAAQIFVLPLLLFHFERFSLLAPLINMVVVPPIPFIMLFGFLGGLFGFVTSSFGALLAMPAYVVASVVLFIIRYAGSLSTGVWNVHFSFSFVLVSYSFIAVFLFYSQKICGRKRKSEGLPHF